ncbi:MAG TPA: rhamnogalacturonan acetylesterase [Pirellulales bacterium]|jgi:pectinesterase|nr:rhamnogalacturonan acetylesterase [Pirellulales bacterium]
MIARVPLVGIVVAVAIASAGEPTFAQTQCFCTLFMAGDSTMAAQSLVPATPARGWGQMLQPYFDDSVRVENFASGGQSSKSFRDSGRWQQILDRLNPGDFVLMQFGHNDNKPDEGRHTAPFDSFQANLERFVSEVRERQATPILATSIVRNMYEADGKTLLDTHGDYLVATRKVAAELNVPLLDLAQKTGNLLTKLGPERSKRLFNNVEPGEFLKYPEGFQDGTHLNALGASRVCDLAIEEIRAKAPELAAYVRPGAARDARH